MRVALGKFACAGIRAHLGGDFEAAAQKAVFHYARKLRSGRPPIGLPRFFGYRAPGDPEVVLDLVVDAEIEDLLEREAKRQGASVDQLVAHAVLIYLAELDFLGAPAAAPTPLRCAGECSRGRR